MECCTELIVVLELSNEDIGWKSVQEVSYRVSQLRGWRRILCCSMMICLAHLSRDQLKFLLQNQTMRLASTDISEMTVYKMAAWTQTFTPLQI